MRAFGLLLALALAWMAMSGCDADGVEVTEADKELVGEELQGRSFRQFDPHLDASPRKAVILDFTVGITLWAQYAEEGHAVNEWEVFAESYSVDGSGSEYTIRFNEPGSAQGFPSECGNCIATSGRLRLRQGRIRWREDILQAERSRRHSPSAISRLQVLDKIQ